MRDTQNTNFMNRTSGSIGNPQETSLSPMRKTREMQVNSPPKQRGTSNLKDLFSFSAQIRNNSELRESFKYSQANKMPSLTNHKRIGSHPFVTDTATPREAINSIGWGVVNS